MLGAWVPSWLLPARGRGTAATNLGLLGHEVLPAGSAQGLQVLVLGPSTTARLERVGACAEPWLCLRQEGVIRTGTHTPIGLLVC